MMTPEQAKREHRSWKDKQRIEAADDIRSSLDARLTSNPNYASFSSFCDNIGLYDVTHEELVTIATSVAVEYERKGWHTRVNDSRIDKWDDVTVKISSTPFDDRTWWQKLWSK